ncbi:MAG: MmcQ/YjbR family DNA-binding protein [Lachnospiraceae bacterium]|nr:MmcQ/YjbR family DNA-binding protein [Lachnospiraceae bacterium]MDE7436597.1 MmcQ/YjbR family DNA-binding protein [Lachnospiraceae bacterium]
MTRGELTEYIEQSYHVRPENPFPKDFESAVFRHKDNQKWFALIMRIGRDKLGIRQEGQVDILDVKAEPQMISAIVGSSGIYPAYHMNKTHWVTVLLDGSAADDVVKSLVDISFALTESRKKRKHSIQQ